MYGISIFDNAIKMFSLVKKVLVKTICKMTMKYFKMKIFIIYNEENYDFTITKKLKKETIY